jgi:hypothetical protein
VEEPSIGILISLPPHPMPLGFGSSLENEGEMKLKLLAAAALVVVSVPAFAADADVRVHRQRVQQSFGAPLIIDYSHNYGPADFYPGTTAPPDRVVVPRAERPYGIYDGFDRYCGQSSANYRGQDGRRYPCN